jgi:hypothetical protein
LSKVVGFALATGVVAVLVGGTGSRLAGADARAAVWLGVGIGAVAQLGLFLLLFVVAFSKRPLLAHGLGMVGRFAVLAAVMVGWLATRGASAAALLLPLVAVLFLTTLMEPFFLSGPERVQRVR